MNIAQRIAALAAVFLITMTAWASPIQDNINGSATPPFVLYGGPDNIGWYYTANATYNLDGIFTFFEPVPNGTGAHTITVQIWTDRPSHGGTLLGEGTFNANSGSGGTEGATFSPVLLSAGSTYFVDFENTIGMGVNLGQWTGPSGGETPSNGATTNLGGWYSDSNDTFPDSGFVSGGAYYAVSTGNVSFSEPILNFTGTLPATGAPEPGALGLLSLGLAGFAAMAHTRRRAR